MARKRVWFVVAGIVCLLGAAASVPAVVGNLGMTDEAHASEHWPGAPGTIETSRVVEERGRHTYYSVLATYDYEVASVVHHGNRVGFYRSGNFDHASDARALVAQYAPGAHVTVYYDPDAPDRAVLLRGGEGIGGVAIVMFALMGVGMLVASILFFLRSRR